MSQAASTTAPTTTPTTPTTPRECTPPLRVPSPLDLLAHAAKTEQIRLPSFSEIMKRMPGPNKQQQQPLPSPPPLGSFQASAAAPQPFLTTRRFSTDVVVVPSSTTQTNASSYRFPNPQQQQHHHVRRFSYNDFLEKQVTHHYNPTTTNAPLHNHPQTHTSSSYHYSETSSPTTSGGIRATKSQVKVLLAMFTENPTPSGIMHHAIAEKLGMTRKAVRNWFQNQRAKIRRLSIQSGGGGSDGSGGEYGDMVRKMSSPQVTFMSLMEKGALIGQQFSVPVTPVSSP
ncbi:hypothetical protein CcCBS67573_g05957 [Chytriomyces confervae]|uniref:Homeobox domain-containing protein n=1 Tax=Chytriomyces confervae TaxID=246404 RepID=A0A507F707_9FUNG|nr:hypothetical protein HDU80_003817 [Chytriomyces hyalinus]TPX72043.1 hypothetical protein CcCBS67573_g05957 [Chytriomyces confervae]